MAGEVRQEPMVEVRHLTRSWPVPGGGRLRVLDLDEVVVAPGERLLVTGPNGAGKSTFLHLVAGLLKPDGGSVRVAGQDLAALPEALRDRFRARNIGYLLQGSPLLEGLTALQNVEATLLFGGFPRARRGERAMALLEQMGVAHRARHRAEVLSGGERQRVALARALATDPPLLLADEPLASLDRDASRHLLDLLERLLAQGRTLLVATHRPELMGGDARVLHLHRREVCP